MGERANQPLQQAVSLGQRLRRERERHNWSQEELASAIGNVVSVSSVIRWEHDKAVPHPYYRDLLCRVFNLSHEALFGATADETDEAVSHLPLWNVPHLRNRYFTGRENLLIHLHSALASQKTVSLTALSGLGGIGKTQTALEYAYRYGEEYDVVLWVRADARQSLISDYILLADLLNLPEKQEVDQQRVVTAVVRWLQHTPQHWLLILDNIEDLDLIAEFLPTRGMGHVLQTTRIQSTGPSIQGIEVDTLSQDEATLLLLRRAKLLRVEAPLELATESARKEAGAICELLSGLPLALDQAGAYIEENQCSLADYLRLYQTRRADLLRRRGGPVPTKDATHAVATTWNLSFERVERTNAAAADLLRLCAFLNPDGIPKSLIMAGGEALGPLLQGLVADPLLLNEAIGLLRRSSLLRHTAETKQLTLHQLVQVVLKDAMTPQTYREWAERAVCVVSQAFPEVEVASWFTCSQYLPHALACAELIEQEEMRFPEAAQLLQQAGLYLYERGRYSEAEPLYQGASVICEQALGPEHLDTARTLNNLAILYTAQGKYQQAEPLYQRALIIREQRPGTAHHEMAGSLNNLAELYFAQGQYEQAEPLYRRALAIWEQMLGPTHPDTAIGLDNLAGLYYAQGKYEQAEPLHQRALAIREQVLGPTHPETADSLNNLAALYHAQGKHAQAELLYQRALSVREQVLGPDHTDTAVSLYETAMFYRHLGQFEQAEPLAQRALSIREQQLGPQYPDTAHSLNGLALLYLEQGKDELAEPLFQRALSILEQVLGSGHPMVAEMQDNYAALLRQTRQQANIRLDQIRLDQIRLDQIRLDQIRLDQIRLDQDIVRVVRMKAVRSTSAQQTAILGELPDVDEEEETAEHGQHKQDPLAAFLATCCELNQLSWVSAIDLWEAYLQWCSESAERFPLHRRAFTASLQARGCTPDRTNANRIWRGLCLIDRQVKQ